MHDSTGGRTLSVGWNDRPGWALGLGVGLLAGLINIVSETPILSPETPLFIFGGTLILALTVTRGLIPGVIATLTMLVPTFVIPLWGVSSGAMAGGLIYLAEIIWLWWFCRKIGSIPLTVILFWFAAGWIFDLAIYRGWAGLDGGYVLLLFVKQLLNGMTNAILAELLLGAGARLGLIGRRRSVPIESFAFTRTVLLTMTPVVVLSLLLARTGYDRVHQSVVNENSLAAVRMASRMDRALAERRDALLSVVGWVQSGGEPFEAGLRPLMGRFPDVEVVAMISPDGRVLRAHPNESGDGSPLVGLDLSRREYVREGLETGETVYSDLFEIVGGADDDGSAGSVTIVEPVRIGGEVTALMVLALDPTRLLADFRGLPAFEEGTVMLLDRRGRLLVARGDPRPLGAHVDSVFVSPRGYEETSISSRIENVFSLEDIELVKRDRRDEAARLGVALRHGSFQRIGIADWGVLVDRPGTFLRARLAPVSWTILGVFLALPILVYGVVRRFTVRISRPYRSAARVADRVARGETERGDLGELARSELTEVSELADALETMDRALWRKEMLSRAREEGLQSQLIQAQKMEAIGLLAGGVAHDFNNSLTPIIGYAGLGREETEDDGVRGHFEEILKAATHAKEVTEELLSFGRKQTLQIGPVNLVERVRRSESLLRQVFPENISLELELMEVGGWVRVDWPRIQQVLMNLAINAREAMPDGGVATIGVSRDSEPTGWPQPERTEAPTGPFVVLSVSDTGEGIDPDILPNIFEPFFTTRSKGRGSGLGLATTYGIVRQHGGWIVVDSEPDEGSTFSVYLQEILAPAESGEVEESEGPERETVTDVEGRVKRILVVEDEPAVLRFVDTILSRDGYEVEAFPDAESALERFREGSSDFDLLLTDIVLPGMSGHRLFQALEEVRPGLPTLFMTGYSHDVLEGASVPERVQLLTKPFGADALVEAVGDTVDQAVEDGLVEAAEDEPSPSVKATD